MSWGYKITILYTGFVALIITMVSLTMREKVDLVSKDYYEQELKYQDKINKVNRTQNLSEPLSWEVVKEKLTLKFPAQLKGKKTSGSIYFFRPSDATMDQTIPIPNDTLHAKTLSTESLKKGMYKMQINWTAGKEEYYNEGIIQIN